MLNEAKLINILMKQNIPLITHLLESISEDYDIELDELKEKYLSSFKKKKRSKTRKGRITGYTLFLKDKKLNEQLKEDFKKQGFGSISRMKGEIWKSMSQKDKSGYNNDAKNLNEKNKEIKEDIEDKEDLEMEESE